MQLKALSWDMKVTFLTLTQFHISMKWSKLPSCIEQELP